MSTPAPSWLKGQTLRRMKHARPSRGFTLVELMVAMALGLLLLGALISLIVSTVTGRTELDRSSRQIENGRYALQLIGDDIESAGFAGNTGLQSWPRIEPSPCPANVAQMGYVSGSSPSLPFAVQELFTTPACLNSGNVKSGAGMLLITRASSQTTAVANAKAQEVYIQASNNGNDATAFPALYPLVVQAGNSEDFKLRDKVGNTALLRKAIHRLYFVSTCNECNGDQTPTLKVAEFVNGSMSINPLVDGVENVQYDYGIDTNNDGAPDCFVSNPSTPDANQISAAACTPPIPAYDWSNASTNWGNVMVTRIHVLARTTEPSAGWKDTRTYQLGMATTVGPFNDQFKRHVYSTVVRLNNPSALRELP